MNISDRDVRNIRDAADLSLYAWKQRIKDHPEMFGGTPTTTPAYIYELRCLADRMEDQIKADSIPHGHMAVPVNGVEVVIPVAWWDAIVAQAANA